MMKIYLDLETIPGENKPERAKAPKTLKKAESIEAYETDPDNIDKDWRKQSLVSIEGRILCIGLAFDDGEPIIISGEEKDIMTEFHKVIKDSARLPYTYVGHNIDGFDMPFIRHRLFKYGLRLAMPDSRYSKMTEDTMIMWAGTNWQDKTSLDKIARYLGVGSKGEIDGSMVFDYWQEGREEEIFEYCKQDVILTREVYKKIAQI